jgi:D-threo-aldose 1-dehydrogenase
VELGFGATGAWGQPWFDEDRACEVLATALRCGVRHIDTAGFYGNGEAQRRLGRCLARLEAGDVVEPRSLTISTKVGKQIGKGGRLVRDYRPQTIEADLATACRALGRQTLDIVYMHGPDEKELATALPALLKARAEGRIDRIGVCSDGLALHHAALHSEIDVLMGRYNLLNRDNATSFRQSRQNGKTNVGIAPLAQALWRRDLMRPRNRADVWALARAVVRSRRELVAAQRLRWIRTVDGWRPLEVVLAFARLNRDLDVLMTTSTRPEHVEQTAAAFRRPIPEELVARLDAVSD